MRAHIVRVAKLHAVGIAEIELAQIALQMLFAAMLIRSDHSALEDRKDAFNGVCGSRVAHVFLAAMIDGFVLAYL